jgi:dienelactone hydrolase
MLPFRKFRLPVFLLLIFFAGLLPLDAGADPGLRNTEVTFRSGELELHGTVVAPADSSVLRPGVVLVAGAGPRKRDAYRPEAEAFARAGIVVLIYDKRTDYSRATSSFGILAADALAGLQLLRRQPGVQADRVGLWGHSEGGWVVPIAAAGSAAVDFVVTVGASGFRPDRTQLWSTGTYLAKAGVPPRLRGPLGLNLPRMLIDAGLFGDTVTDPVANLSRIRQPLLALWGAHDLSVPPVESRRIFADALDAGGNHRYVLRTIADANHNLRRSTDGTKQSAEFAPGFVDTVTQWILGQPMTVQDSPAEQAMTSSAVKPLAWYEQVPLQLGLLILLLCCFVSYPVGAVVLRVRGRRVTAVPGRWAARFVAAGGVVLVLGVVDVVGSLLATAATSVGDMVVGRPWFWLALQVLAVGILVAAVVIARRAPKSLRLRLLLAGAILLVPWAGYWGLLSV